MLIFHSYVGLLDGSIRENGSSPQQVFPKAKMGDSSGNTLTSGVLKSLWEIPKLNGCFLLEQSSIHGL